MLDQPELDVVVGDGFSLNFSDDVLGRILVKA